MKKGRNPTLRVGDLAAKFGLREDLFVHYADIRSYHMHQYMRYFPPDVDTLVEELEKDEKTE